MGLIVTKLTSWSTNKSINIAIGSFIFGSTVFLLAYLGMLQNFGIGVYNQPVLSWMVEHRESFITIMMKMWTSVASPIIVGTIIGTIAVIWGIAKREIWRPMLLFIMVVSTGIITAVVKLSTESLRPPKIEMIAPFETGYSFPSGHTLIVTISLLIIGYLICSRQSSRKRISIWLTTTIVGILVIAASRLYLGYHWFTDISASIGLGFMIFAMAIIIDVLVRKNVKNVK